MRHPFRTLVPPSSWKAAALNACFRALAFSWSNLDAGTHKALRAMIVEATFAILAAGLIGAISQQVRHANLFLRLDCLLA